MAVVTTGQLREDVRQVVHDGEALARAKAGQVREKMSEIGKAAASRARGTGRQADAYVRDNPWGALIAGAAAGLFIGFLLGRGDGA